MTDDVVLNKVAVIERCLARVREEYRDDVARLDNPTIQDSIVLNLQRACEAVIDIAMHAIASARLGVPQDSRDAFTILERAGTLDASLAERMRRMVGFRNVAVHEYTALSRPILEKILTERLGDFEALCRALVRRRKS